MDKVISLALRLYNKLHQGHKKLTKSFKNEMLLLLATMSRVTLICFKEKATISSKLDTNYLIEKRISQAFDE